MDSLLFREAISFIDAGDTEQLKKILSVHPELLYERLDTPDEGFFKHPYLLWFVAEDPVRNNTLPSNIADITSMIIEAARKENVKSFKEQIDYALRLVAWSWVARQCNVQIALIDVLVDAGAEIGGMANDALVNGNFAAAAHLIERGGKITLAAAVCLDRWEDAKNLIVSANEDEKQLSLTLAALHGKTAAISFLIDHGVDINKPSEHLYSHATPLHHAVSSGKLAAVKLLVTAGANINVADTAWNGTPLGWANHYIEENAKGEYAEIAVYLRSTNFA